VSGPPASYKACGTTANIDYPAVLQTVRMGNTLTQHWVEQDQDSRPEQHLRFQGQYFDVETGNARYSALPGI